MDCLKGYIGIQGPGAPTPAIPDPLPVGAATTDYFSGLYINQLPGVSIEVLEDISDEEQETYLNLWDEVENRALLKFTLAVKAKLNECYKITDSTVVRCLVCESKYNFAIALWYFEGVELMIERTSSTRLNRFTTIDLDQAEKLKADFFTEYQAALADAVMSLDPVNSDCVTTCLPCNGPVRFREQTP